MARHDRARTGTATGTGNLTDPAGYFRYYLGGSLFGPNMLTYDVDADGDDDVLMVTGGRVVARTVRDDDLWSSPPRGFSSLVDLADLDGDGAVELVLTSNDQVFVLDPRDASVLWEEPRGEMGTIGGTRLADFDGDGSMDVLIGECGCCGVNSGYPGAIYTFVDGFAAARRLFEIPTAYCGYMRAVTVVDVDGSGAPELLLPSADRLQIYRPSTGAMIAESPALGGYAYWNRCWPANLDADPGEEIACVLMENNSSVTNRWRVTVLDYDATGSALNVMWSVVLAPDATGDVRVLDPVVDLDGDGTQELVVAVALSGVWETRIYDGATGALDETLPGVIVVGHITTPSGRQLVTRSSTALSGWTYDGTTAAATFDLPNHDVFTAYDRAAAARRAVPSELFSLDLDGDGDDDLLAREPTATSSRLVAYAIDGSSTTEIASYVLAPGTDAQAAWVIPRVTAAGAILAVSYSDGFMIIHDAMLRPALTGAEFEVATLRTGGYYAAGAWRDLSRSPVTSALEAGAPEAIIVGDARGALLRLDASEASLASGPVRAWERLYTSTPSIVDGLVDGSRAIACFSVRDPSAAARQQNLTVLTPDGAMAWSAPVDDFPLMDIVPGTFDGDTIPDLVFHWGSPSDTLTRTRAVSGADGATLWEAAPVETGSGRQAAGIAVGRFDGDDRDDVIWQGGATRALTGVDGAQLAALGVLDHDLSTTLWTSSDDDRPYPYGAVVSCATDRVVLVTGSWAHASRLKMTELSPGVLGTESSVHLGSGRRFASQAELDAAGVFAGQLTSVAIHPNLAGDGTPAALVGSTDGWLYWINPCDGSLVRAIDLGVAVGQAVFGDTDRDGNDEILVSAADGYLYGFKQRYAETPAWVNDIDPASPTSTDDADFITTEDTLIARWAAVAGALRYEVGAFDADGSPLLAARWQDVGSDTEVTLTGLPLVNGRRYHFGVRALSADGPSVDAVSDGAVVRFAAPAVDGGTSPTMDAGSPPSVDAGTTPPAGDGCGCRVVGGSGGASPLWWAAVALLAWRRRRACRSASGARSSASRATAC
jgi:hypothetical protein